MQLTIAALLGLLLALFALTPSIILALIIINE